MTEKKISSCADHYGIQNDQLDTFLTGMLSNKRRRGEEAGEKEKGEKNEGNLSLCTFRYFFYKNISEVQSQNSSHKVLQMKNILCHIYFLEIVFREFL